MHRKKIPLQGLMTLLQLPIDCGGSDKCWCIPSPFNSIDVAVWIQLRGSSYFCISFNQRMKICNGSPPNEASSTGPYLQQTPFHWVSLGPIFICWKECESTWPELGSWRQPRCDITLTDFVPLSPCFLPFALHQFVFVCSPGCSLLRFAHPEGRGQSGARVVLSARPLQPPFGGLPERWVTFAQRLHSSVLYSRPLLCSVFFVVVFLSLHLGFWQTLLIHFHWLTLSEHAWVCAGVHLAALQPDINADCSRSLQRCCVDID